MDQITAVILAAGKGSRLKCDTPKPLLPISGKKMLDFVLDASASLPNLKSSLVVGHQKELIESVYRGVVDEIVWQKEQKGTGHAIMSFMGETKLDSDLVLVLCADTPLITKDVIREFYEHMVSNSLDACVMSFVAENPYGYGRIQQSESGVEIIEEKDASDDQRKISEVNSGIYLFKKNYLEKQLKTLTTSNSQGEFYLTDVFKKNLNVASFNVQHGERLLMGVNDLVQLSIASEEINKRKIQSLQRSGVLFTSPSTCLIDEKVTIASGTIIGKGVELRGSTKIGENCYIDSDSLVIESEIGDNVTVNAKSIIEKSVVKNHSSIGPVARLRPGSVIGESCKIGNFVEVKKSELKAGAKVSHLSYVGDSEIGENTNIGCGFISCNYDGKNKHKTIIGSNCFIGSDSQTVAPVTIGNDCFVASSTTVTNDMPDGSFGISRSKLIVKEEMAKRFIKK